MATLKNNPRIGPPASVPEQKKKDPEPRSAKHPEARSQTDAKEETALTYFASIVNEIIVPSSSLTTTHSTLIPFR